MATGLFCLAMTGGGFMNLIREEHQREELALLGYPVYVMTILGAGKILGVIAVLIPRAKLLKEWAYAGFTFLLIGATASHIFAGDALGETITPVIVFSLGMTSYLLRPTSRRLQISASTDEASAS